MEATDFYLLILQKYIHSKQKTQKILQSMKTNSNKLINVRFFYLL